MDTNVCVLKVRIGQDAELKYTKSGTAVARFSGATNKKLKGGEEQTSWFEFEMWGSGAEAVAQYLTKGKSVTVTCEAKQDRWEDQEGAKRSKIVFVVRELDFNSPPRSD